MLLKNLRFVCAQPATLYYAWQVEVMLNNFIEMGVNPNNVDIVCWKDNDEVPQMWSDMANRYPARFFFYKDTRVTTNYISSIRPNILKQHWLQFPQLENETIFYHDCDIIFTKPISEWITDEMIGDNKWYGSDTRWYIAHSYIKGKGQDIMNTMCSIMHMDESVIEANELNAIGAQYLMKGVDFQFWNRVESDSEILFKDISSLNMHKVTLDSTYHPLQIWCADMWAVLWGAWRRGYETICHPNYEFSWGTSTEQDYHNLNIMHNAGVTTSAEGLFYKAEYITKLPYGLDLPIKEHTASWYYYDWVKKTEKKSVLI